MALPPYNLRSFGAPSAGIPSGNIPISGGSNPLGLLPIQQVPDLLSEYATRILPMENGARGEQNNLNYALASALKQKQVSDAEEAGNPNIGNKNVVFNPAGATGITPLQNAQLGIKQAAIQGQNDRNAANLAEKQESGQTSDAIKQQRADVYQFKATHPNLKLVEQKGGNIIAVDPITGKGMDTGFSTGTLSDEDKMNLNVSGQMQEIAARGDQQRTTNSQNNTERSQNTLADIAARGNQTRQTNAAKPVKSQTAADLKTQYFNKAQQLMNDPAFAPYIKNGDKSGEFTIDPNTPQDTYHMINSQIYGSPAANDVELPADSSSDVNSKYKVSIQD